MSTLFREPAAETREDDDDEVGSLSPFNVQTIRNHCPIIGQMHTTLAMLNDNIHTLLLPALAVGVTRLETRQQRQIRTTRHHIRRDHTQDVTQQIGPFQTSTVYPHNKRFIPSAFHVKESLDWPTKNPPTIRRKFPAGCGVFRPFASPKSVHAGSGDRLERTERLILTLWPGKFH